MTLEQFLFIFSAIVGGSGFIAFAVSFSVRVFSLRSNSSTRKRMVSLLADIVMILIFGYGTWYMVKMAEHTSFFEGSGSDEYGELSSSFARSHLEATADNRCEHVSRSDGEPIIIFTSSYSEKRPLCGLPLSAISNNKRLPFFMKGNKVHILVGTWPFSYTLISTRVTE